MTNQRIAIIGAGHLGRIHARIASKNDSVDLVAVADPCPSAREAIERETGVLTIADYRKLLPANSNARDGRVEVRQPDAVIIATPTTTHHAIATQFLGAGIPTFIEKPIAATVREARELVRLAAQVGAPLQIGHVERFNPALCEARPHIQSPKYITAERLSSYPGRSLDVGVVLDLMIHDIDVVLSLVQSTVERVEAIGVTVVGGEEDMATARLYFQSGCIANLTASRVSYTQRRTMQVFTPNGCATLDFASGAFELVRPGERLSAGGIDVKSLTNDGVREIQDTLFETLLVREKHAPPAVNAIDIEQHEFFECVRTGRNPRVDGVAGRDALAVAEWIVAVMNAHRWNGAEDGPIGPKRTAPAASRRAAA